MGRLDRGLYKGSSVEGLMMAKLEFDLKAPKILETVYVLICTFYPRGSSE
jgi:hypothetical protein